MADANSILIVSNDYPNAGITGGNNSASGDYYYRLRGMTVFESQALFHGRNQEECGCLKGCRYLLHVHDRDGKFCQSFRELLKAGGVHALRLPARSPNLNSYAEPRGAQPSGQRQSDLVSFADAGKKEPGSSSVSRTTGRPAEVLREGSGLKIDGTADDGLAYTAYIKDAGKLPWQKTSRGLL